MKSDVLFINKHKGHQIQEKAVVVFQTFVQHHQNLKLLQDFLYYDVSVFLIQLSNAYSLWNGVFPVWIVNAVCFKLNICNIPFFHMSDFSLYYGDRDCKIVVHSSILLVCISY